MGKHFKHHHSTVMHDIMTMSQEDIEQLYNIEIDEDGTVWDPSEGKEFPNVTAWGTYIDQQNREEDLSSFLPRSSRHRYDDE